MTETETLAYGYPSESTQRELSNEYQHDSVEMVFKNRCVLVLRTKVATALKGLMEDLSQYLGVLCSTLLMVYCRLGREYPN